MVISKGSNLQIRKEKGGIWAIKSKNKSRICSSSEASLIWSEGLEEDRWRFQSHQWRYWDSCVFWAYARRSNRLNTQWFTQNQSSKSDSIENHDGWLLLFEISPSLKPPEMAITGTHSQYIYFLVVDLLHLFFLFVNGM